jgi:hypothetical protein
MMPAPILALAALASLLLLRGAAGQHVVGPSAITQYSGGGGRRGGGYGYVREPAEGFFVAGSSIKGLNGVYARVEKVPSAIKHVFHCPGPPGVAKRPERFPQ